MWLLDEKKAPDHRIIVCFRTGFLADACENLFYQMVTDWKILEIYLRKPFLLTG